MGVVVIMLYTLFGDAILCDRKTIHMCVMSVILQRILVGNVPLISVLSQVPVILSVTLRKFRITALET